MPDGQELKTQNIQGLKTRDSQAWSLRASILGMRLV
jgi:hypothetical protein